MPHTLPPPIIDSSILVHPAGHGQPAYTTGSTIPAVLPDSGSTTPARPDAIHSASSTSNPTSRSQSHSRDPFFQPHTGDSAVSSPLFAQAQEASYASDLERAIRRSKKDAARSESRGRAVGVAGEHRESESKERGMSRIRGLIREIVNDPFFHRPTKEEASEAAQSEQMKRIIAQEIAAAQAATFAGDVDRARSKSRSARSPIGSGANSREPSRSRLGKLFGHGGSADDRGAAGFGHADHATVKE